MRIPRCVGCHSGWSAAVSPVKWLCATESNGAHWDQRKESTHCMICKWIAVNPTNFPTTERLVGEVLRQRIHHARFRRRDNKHIATGNKLMQLTRNWHKTHNCRSWHWHRVKMRTAHTLLILLCMCISCVDALTQIAKFGDCVLSLDSAFELSSEGTCSTTAGYLDLENKGIKSLAPGVFTNMSKMEWVWLMLLPLEIV